MPSWRALDAKACRELSILSVTERELAPICRLMPPGAAYDPTRVAVAPYAVHTGIRDNRKTGEPIDIDGHPCHRYSGRVRPVVSPKVQRSIPGGSTPNLVRAVQIWLR